MSGARKRTRALDEHLDRHQTVGVIEQVGRVLMRKLAIAGRALLLFCEACAFLPLAGRSLPMITRQIEMAGFGSIMVIALIAGLTGMIMAYQFGLELVRYEAQANLGAIIGATFCREMGPIWAAVIILARVGASMAAELGTMAVNEEIDALRTMNISPVRFLVMPRLLALVISMPLLTAIADWVGMLGGALISYTTFDVSMSQFMSSAQDFLRGSDFFSGLFKSVVFGCIIATVACDRGLNTSDGAEGVGRSTTDSVVLNVVFVLLADLVLNAVIQVLFQPVGT
jgi:phospholipid/cholesterol/gamma-HCH transport system permease protein